VVLQLALHEEDGDLVLALGDLKITGSEAERSASRHEKEIAVLRAT